MNTDLLTKKTILTITLILLLLVLVPASYGVSSLTVNGQKGNVTISEGRILQVEAYSNESNSVKKTPNNYSELYRNGDIIVNERVYESQDTFDGGAEVTVIRQYNESFAKIQLAENLLEGDYKYTWVPNHMDRGNNKTVNVTVVEGYEGQGNSAMIYVGVVFAVITFLTVLPLFFYEALWIKSGILTLLNILFVIMLRFGSEFIDTTMPGTHLAESLNTYYVWMVTILPWSVMFGVAVTGFLVLYALYNLSTGENRDFEEDLESFGKK